MGSFMGRLYTMSCFLSFDADQARPLLRYVSRELRTTLAVLFSLWATCMLDNDRL